MNKSLLIGIGVIVLVALGIWAVWAFSNKPQGPLVPAQEATTTTNAETVTPVTGVYTIAAADNGKTFSYPVTSRFMVELDGKQYPQAELNCSPNGIIGSISNTVAVTPPLYAARFETVQPGTCLLSDRDFSVHILVTGDSTAEGDTASLNQMILDNGVYITPLAVVSDSRCPTDVQCIQAGAVSLSVKLSDGTHSETVTAVEGSPIAFGNKHVTLMSVTPAKKSTTTIKPSDYRFTFSVTFGMGGEAP